MAEYRKKLIEVALPLKKINEQSAREKSIRHGHPSTLHLWWARRPLAACRAVLFAQLVDDPSSDPAYRNFDGRVDEERAGIKRAELFNLIEELVCWENTNNPRVINRARAEIARCVASRKIELGELQKKTIVFGPEEGKKHPDGFLPNDGRFTAWQVNCRLASAKAVNHFLSEYAPPVLDPFAGGGSIPLEAQRLGLRAHASDLNPVAVLINKALIEIPPKFAGMPPVNPEWQQKSASEKALNSSWQGASGLAEDVRYYGKWMRDEAERRIGHLYPKIKVTKEMTISRPELEPLFGKVAKVDAWIWSRTVTCPNPGCQAEVPLLGSLSICRKRKKEASLRIIVDRNESPPRIDINVVSKPADKSESTMNRNGMVCPCCKTFQPFQYLREQGCEGKMGMRLVAIAARYGRIRIFLPALSDHITTAKEVKKPDIPQLPIPERALGFRVQLYGIDYFHKLYSTRQLVALSTLCSLVEEARKLVLSADEEQSNEYSSAIAVYLALIVGRYADYGSTMTYWDDRSPSMQKTFSLPTLQMRWSFPETNPFGDFSGNLDSMLDSVVKNIERLPAGSTPGIVSQRDAAIDREDYTNFVISTDPPYYDNIGYAALSDYFYMWLREALREAEPSIFSTMMTPKSQELIAEAGRHKTRQDATKFFEDGLFRVFGAAQQYVDHQNPITIFYAFKQSELQADEGVASTGWEVFLAGLLKARWKISGTIPLRTEQPGGLRVEGRNALASSVVVVCVPRHKEAPLATRRELIGALKRELPEALRKLQSGSIAPVDLAQAAIGPGMAIFSRYTKVVEADGSSMTVRTALTLINQMLDEVLAEQEGEFDADTRWAVAWFEQYGVQEGPYGMAETLSRAKNTSVQGLAEAGIVKSRSGSVQLLDRSTLPAEWDPAADNRLTAWEGTQHLIRALDQEGEIGAAELLKKLGGSYGDKARDLAYRLYSICERKGWAHEALAYNSIVLAWPEISKLALASPKARQQDLFE